MTAFASGEVITASKLNAVITQFVGYGERTTPSTGSSSATAVGVLRVSNVDLVAGRAYWIGYSCHPDDATVADVCRTEVRYSTAGDAVVGSTLVFKTRVFNPVSAGPRHFMVVFFPAVTGTYSFLLCQARNSGVGSTNLFCDADRATELFIANVGTVTDTGTDV